MTELQLNLVVLVLPAALGTIDLVAAVRLLRSSPRAPVAGAAALAAVLSGYGIIAIWFSPNFVPQISIGGGLLALLAVGLTERRPRVARPENSAPPAGSYWLIFEFKGDDSGEFERVLELAEKFEEKITCGTVDGNDVGQGVVNLFIITTEPRRYFEEAMALIAPAKLPLTAAGYRGQDSDEYVRLWPENDPAPFVLK